MKEVAIKVKESSQKAATTKRTTSKRGYTKNQKIFGVSMAIIIVLMLVIILILLFGLKIQRTDNQKIEKVRILQTSPKSLTKWISNRNYDVVVVEAGSSEMILDILKDGRVIATVWLNTCSPFPEDYGWFGVWEERNTDNSGYIRLNESYVNGARRFVGEQTNGKFGDEFVEKVVIE